MNERKFDGISTRDLAAEAMIAVDDVYKSITKLNKKIEEVSDRVDDMEADLVDTRENAEYAESEVTNIGDILSCSCPYFKEEDDEEDEDCDSEDEDSEPLTYDEFKEHLTNFLSTVGISNIKVGVKGLEIPFEDNYKQYLSEMEEELNEDYEEVECSCRCEGHCGLCSCKKEDPLDEIQAILDEEDLDYGVINDGNGSAMVIPFDDNFNLEHCVKTYTAYKEIKEKSGNILDILKKVMDDARDSK